MQLNEMSIRPVAATKIITVTSFGCKARKEKRVRAPQKTKNKKHTTKTPNNNNKTKTKHKKAKHLQERVGGDGGRNPKKIS